MAMEATNEWRGKKYVEKQVREIEEKGLVAGSRETKPGS